MRRNKRLKKGAAIPAAPAKRTRRGGFRPLLAGDGSIVLTGTARGDFEIPRDDARRLLNLVRRLTDLELFETAQFLERLDKAQIGA